MKEIENIKIARAMVWDAFSKADITDKKAFQALGRALSSIDYAISIIENPEPVVPITSGEGLGVGQYTPMKLKDLRAEHKSQNAIAKRIHQLSQSII